MGPDRLAACGRKRLLFVGDSTMQELMWELIFLTSCGVKNESVHGSACTPISRKNLPVHHCANRRCMALGQQWANESGVNSKLSTFKERQALGENFQPPLVPHLDSRQVHMTLTYAAMCHA